MILGFDTATAATAVALALDDGSVHEARHDPEPGERPRHAQDLLVLADGLLRAHGAAFADLDLIAAGVGPGTFTGLRIGLATARALSQGHGIPLAGVSSLRALAHGAQSRGAAKPAPVLAVLDARRGEAFAAAWSDGTELMGACALGPDDLAARAAELPAGTLAVGDGAVRFRDRLEPAGIAVPADGDPRHRLAAASICELAAAAPPSGRDALLPDYVREPDAKPPGT